MNVISCLNERKKKLGMVSILLQCMMSTNRSGGFKTPCASHFKYGVSSDIGVISCNKSQSQVYSLCQVLTHNDFVYLEWPQSDLLIIKFGIETLHKLSSFGQSSRLEDNMLPLYAEERKMFVCCCTHATTPF